MKIAVVLCLVLATSCAAEEGTQIPAGRATALTADLQPDGEVTMRTVADFKAKRDALLKYVWGKTSLPTGLPKVAKDVAPCDGRVADDCNPLGLIPNLKRVDNLTVEMELGEHSLAHHLIPVSGNRRLVIMHQGHACDFGDKSGGEHDYGEVAVIEALVAAGYSVLGMYMPRMEPGNCDQTRYPGDYGFHDYAFIGLKVASGSPLKFWLEPISVALNYLKSKSAADAFPNYLSYDLMGLSGGGWTTVFYAALDPSIQVSVPIAGSVPLYMRKCEGRTNLSAPPYNCNWTYDGDSEQTFTATYQVAGFLDLYALGAQGANRRQVQVLNRRDNCCFGEAQFNGPGMVWDKALQDYAQLVKAAVVSTRAGSFETIIDEHSTKHQISEWAITNLVLPAFKRAQAVPDAGMSNNAPDAGIKSDGRADPRDTGPDAEGAGTPDAAANTPMPAHDSAGGCAVAGRATPLVPSGLGLLLLLSLARRRRWNQRARRESNP